MQKTRNERPNHLKEGAINGLGTIIGLIVAMFEPPIDPVELERASMRSLSWPTEDPEEFLDEVLSERP